MKYKISILFLCMVVFYSCQKEEENCKNCEDQINWLWDDDLSSMELNALNAMYQAQGYNDAADFYTQTYIDGLALDTMLRSSQEYCDDDLAEMESTPDQVIVEDIISIEVDCN